MNMEPIRFFDGPRLLADVGGTNARFAIETAPRVFEAVNVLSCKQYASLGAAITAYLASPGAAPHAAAIRHAAVAIANPVDGDLVSMTNHTWSFSIAALREQLNLSTLLVVNDFTALAMALPHLRPSQRARVGGGMELPGRTIGLIGPGTGLGVSGIVPVDGRWVALASEGGHASEAERATGADGPQPAKQEPKTDGPSDGVRPISPELRRDEPGTANLSPTDS